MRWKADHLALAAVIFLAMCLFVWMTLGDAP